MKLILSMFLVALSFAVSAAVENGNATEIKNNASIENVTFIDRGKKKNRHNKRLNKKRKRKCQQFGKRVYAG